MTQNLNYSLSSSSGSFVWLLCLSAGRSWASFAGRSRSWWRRSWTSTGFWIPACTLQPTRPSNVFKHTPPDHILTDLWTEDAAMWWRSRHRNTAWWWCHHAQVWVMSFGVWYQQLCVCQENLNISLHQKYGFSSTACNSITWSMSIWIFQALWTTKQKTGPKLQGLTH